MKISTLYFFVFLLIISSCVKDTDYEIPLTDEIYKETPPFYGKIVPFEQVIASASSSVKNYETDDAIEGYVISSDEAGNFYKKIYLQNAEKTAGISLAINKIGLYTEFPVGSKIQLRLKGLSMQINNGGLEVGYQQYTGSSGKITVGSMPELIYQKHLYKLDEPLKTEAELSKINNSVKVLKINANVNQLITLQNVSFEKKSVGKTFHLSENDTYQGTNINLVDFEGVKLAFRTSRYAKFASDEVPSGTFTVTGVLTKYGTSYQFLISNILNISDLKTNSNVESSNHLEAEDATVSDYKTGKNVILRGKITIIDKKPYIKLSDETAIQLYAKTADFNKLSAEAKKKLNTENQVVSISGKFTDYKPKNGNLVRRIVYSKEADLIFE